MDSATGVPSTQNAAPGVPYSHGLAVGTAPTTNPPTAQKMPTQRPILASDLSATCPMICMVTSAGLSALPIHNLQFRAEVQISTAIVSLQLDCTYPSTWGASQLIFFLPKTHDTTISEFTIKNKTRDSIYATAVVPIEDVRKNGWTMSKPAGNDAQLSKIDLNDPELFTLFLPNTQPGDTFHVDLHYFHPMDFEQGQYILRLPTTLPAQLLSMGPPQNTIDINLVINSGVPDSINYTVPTHKTTVLSTGPGTVTVTADKSSDWSNCDFEAAYQVWGQSIVASVNVQQPSRDNVADPRGTFAVAASPPAPDHTPAFSRSVIFLVDRSGSMDGEPIQSAARALSTGLTLLSPLDQFAVCAFDHEQLWWSNGLVDASPANLDLCMTWMQSHVVARGGTDIMTPTSQAFGMLQGCRGLPYIFLVTDGAVNNERDICKYVDSTVKQWPQGLNSQGFPSVSPRVSTFAVGSFCNHFFLKQLATMARGNFDVAFRSSRIQVQMERLMLAASKPVLSNITLEIEGLKDCELYPFPIPDLFCGQPLLVAGKFNGIFPQTVKLNGVLPSGQPWSQVIHTTAASHMPLDKIFAKNQMDLLTATAWLNGTEEKDKVRISELSIASGIPCAYTRTVGFETTAAKYQQLQQDKVKPANKRAKIAAYAVGAAGVALLAGTAAVLVSGDVAATLANTLVGGAGGFIGDIGANVGDFASDACCGDGCCDVDCGDCDCSCDCFGDCADGLGDICGAVCEGLGSVLGCFCSVLCSS